MPLATPIENVPVIRSAPPEDDLITRWRQERDRSREELGMVSLANEMARSSDEEDYAPELPADLLRDAETEPPKPPTVSVLAEKTRRRELHRPSFLDQIEGLEEGPRVRAELASSLWDRWRRNRPWVVAALLVAILGVWWFWPRSTPIEPVVTESDPPPPKSEAPQGTGPTLDPGTLPLTTDEASSNPSRSALPVESTPEPQP
jgi:hypothetical protein